MKAASNLLKSVLHKKRYGVLFDGVDDYVTVPDAPSLDISDNITVEFMFLPLAVVSGYAGHPIRKGPVDTINDQFVCYFFGNDSGGEDRTLRFYAVSGGVWAAVSPGKVLDLGRWYHVAWRYRSSVGGTLYVDTVSQGAPVGGGALMMNSTPLHMGGDVFVNCLMDEVRVYRRYLSEEEIVAHGRGVFADESGLSGYWGLDDGAGTVVTDLSGYANHGTLNGGAAWTENYPYPGDERLFLMADLYTFTLVGGLTTRYTSADVDITANGNVYSSSGPKFKRSLIREVRGVEVDTLSIELAADTSHLISGVSWLKAIKTGLLDGATVKLERAFLTDWRYAPAGVLTRFAGRVAPSSAGRTRGTIQVKSDLELLNVMWPRSLYQPGCRNTLYDAGCTVSRAAFTVTGTVQAGSTPTSVNVSQSNAADFATLGRIVFTSGALNGVTRSIKLWTPGNAKLALPLPVAPTTGDGVSIEAGCAKRLNEDCITKFNNKPNFRAESFIPIPETVL